MINEFLNFGETPSDPDTNLLFKGQITVQSILVAVALICIPIMLLVKPIHFKCTHHDHPVQHAVKEQPAHMSEGGIQSIDNGESQTPGYGKPAKKESQTDQIELIAEILAKEGTGNQSHAFSEFFIH